MPLSDSLVVVPEFADLVFLFDKEMEDGAIAAHDSGRRVND